MSPEQAGGSKDLDGRSDLYSLGCVLYEMLAGQPPFTGPTVESLVRQHLSAEPPNITNIRPSVPSWAVSALQRALAKTPADRFNPVALFGEALGPRASTSVTSGPVVSPTALRQRSSWEPIALIGIAAVAVVAGTVAVARWMQPGPSESVATQSHPRTAITVLPFQNLSAEGPHSYFAGGLHDEVITQLAKVAALQVIGRTSALTY
jgi:serine/threonine-protein kinase